MGSSCSAVRSICHLFCVVCITLDFHSLDSGAAYLAPRATIGGRKPEASEKQRNMCPRFVWMDFVAGPGRAAKSCLTNSLRLASLSSCAWLTSRHARSQPQSQPGTSAAAATLPRPRSSICRFAAVVNYVQQPVHTQSASAFVRIAGAGAAASAPRGAFLSLFPHTLFFWRLTTTTVLSMAAPLFVHCRPCRKHHNLRQRFRAHGESALLGTATGWGGNRISVWNSIFAHEA